MRLNRLFVSLLIIVPTIVAADSSITENRTIVCNTNGGQGTVGGSCPANQSSNPTIVDKIEAAKAKGSGNPINVLNGNKFEQATDIQAVGDDYALRLNRYYNSRSSQRGLFGIGWRHDYEMQLQDIDDQIDIIQADGRKISFTKTAAALGSSTLFVTRYVADKSELGYIERSQSSNPSKATWIWTLPTGKQFEFVIHKQINSVNQLGMSRYGQLSRVTEQADDPSSPYWALTYGVDGKLAQVRNHNGDTLKFAYETTKSGLPKISVTSSTIRQNNSNNNNSASKWVYLLDQKGNLAQVVSPTGVRTGYQYNDPYDAHNLTAKYSYENKQPQLITQWTYDAYDRATSSTHKDGVEKVSVVYDNDTVIPTQANHIFTNVLTNSIGETTNYRYQYKNGEAQLLSVTGAGCVTCGPTNVSYEYDSAGRVTKTSKLDDNGQVIASTSTSYDTLGRTIKITQTDKTKEDNQQTWLGYRYDNADYPMLPTSITRPSVVEGKISQTSLTYDKSGNVVAMTESGFSPAVPDSQINPAAHTSTPIERITRFHYSQVNGRDVVTAIDAPKAKTNAKSDPNDSTYYVWDERGENITEIRYSEGLTESFDYQTIAGKTLPIKHTAPDGVTTTLSYNAEGLPITMQRGDQTVKIAYDSKQRPIEWQNQLNQTITAIYDDSKQQVIYQLYDGQQIVNQYNTEGQLVNRQWLDDKGSLLIDSGMIESNITKESKPIHKNMVMALDSIQVMTPLDIPIVKYPREANQWIANIAEIENTAKPESKVEFNPVEQLMDLVPRVDPSQILVDKKNINKPQALPSNAIYTRLYDDFKRLVYNHDIKTDPTVIEYGIGDQPIVIQSQTNHKTATYDSLGRVLQTVSCQTDDQLLSMKTGCEKVNYHYEGAHLTKITDPNQTTEFKYDEQSRLDLESVQFKNSSQVWQTRYQYDELDRIKRVELPEGANLIYRYENTRQPSEVKYQPPTTNWTQKLIRAVNNDYQSTVLLSGIKSDSMRGLLSFKHSNGQSVKANYDLNGRLNAWQDGDKKTEINNVKSNSTESKQQSIQNKDNIFNLNDNKSELNENLVYGSQGQLKQVLFSGQEPIEYKYNYALQRISKQQGDVENLYIWKRNDLLDAEIKKIENKEVLSRRYIYLGTTPVAIIDYDSESNAKIYSIHSDVYGQPQQITDQDNIPVWKNSNRATTQPSGTIKASALRELKKPNFRFSIINSAHAEDIFKNTIDYSLLAEGRYLDTETGYHYNGSTYYNPKTSKNIANSLMSFNAAPMRFSGNTGLVNNFSGTIGGTGTIGGSTPTIDWVKVGNIGKNSIKVCAVIGGKAVSTIGSLIYPSSLSRCASQTGAPGSPIYPECIGIYNEGKSQTTDKSDEKINGKPAIKDVEPDDFCEQLALAEAKAGAGRHIMKGQKMSDEPRLIAHYGPGPWIKKEHVRECTAKGRKREVTIHYFHSESSKKNVELKFTKR